MFVMWFNTTLWQIAILSAIEGVPMQYGYHCDVCQTSSHEKLPTFLFPYQKRDRIQRGSCCQVPAPSPEREWRGWQWLRQGYMISLLCYPSSLSNDWQARNSLLGGYLHSRTWSDQTLSNLEDIHPCKTYLNKSKLSFHFRQNNSELMLLTGFIVLLSNWFANSTLGIP